MPKQVPCLHVNNQCPYLDTHEKYTKDLEEDIKEEQRYNVGLVDSIRELNVEIKKLGHI